MAQCDRYLSEYPLEKIASRYQRGYERRFEPRLFGGCPYLRGGWECSHCVAWQHREPALETWTLCPTTETESPVNTWQRYPPHFHGSMRRRMHPKSARCRDHKHSQSNPGYRQKLLDPRRYQFGDRDFDREDDHVTKRKDAEAARLNSR